MSNKLPSRVASIESVRVLDVVKHLRGTKWDETSFERAGEWRHHVPAEIVAEWSTLSDDALVCIFIMAHDLAVAELWD